MKTIHLNLASKPYRDFRVPYAVLGIAALVALVLMVYNVLTAYRYLVDTKETRAEIAAIDEEAARERALAETMEQRIASIDAATLDEQARFINQQIRERAFSWSEMMTGLETLLPGDIRLTSLNPSVDEEGNVKLSLQCVSRNKDGLILLLDRLYASPSFGKSFPSTDAIEGTGLHRLGIETVYFPSGREVKK
ncbi:MAG: hypothetical protein NDJ92_05675 [Thermoanaerobaculia bacterium]|nr:hypothetical protein [Thermoanaerobaculia bacterium]